MTNTATITIFAGITINGEPLSDVDVARRYARLWTRDVYDESGVFAVGDSLFDLIDEATGLTADLEAWLADPANRDDINYSDIYKDVYGVRP